ncbi:MAG: hypothetical protein LBD75_06715 [Candidatus Peribacteria bacterium]|jgi:hypothetical protein|nr:hypothetical protein [Candidatus Peribacteria bacterium]
MNDNESRKKAHQERFENRKKEYQEKLNKLSEQERIEEIEFRKKEIEQAKIVYKWFEERFKREKKEREEKTFADWTMYVVEPSFFFRRTRLEEDASSILTDAEIDGLIDENNEYLMENF